MPPYSCPVFWLTRGQCRQVAPPDEPSAKGDPRWVTGHAASRPAVLRLPVIGQLECRRFSRAYVTPCPPALRPGTEVLGGAVAGEALKTPLARRLLRGT